MEVEEEGGFLMFETRLGRVVGWVKGGDLRLEKERSWVRKGRSWRRVDGDASRFGRWDGLRPERKEGRKGDGWKFFDVDDRVELRGCGQW